MDSASENLAPVSNPAASHPPTQPVCDHSAETPPGQPAFEFPRRPGETARAFSAFITYFDLGHSRSLQAVADQLGETIGNVKNWSSRHSWNGRINDFNSGLLQSQVLARTALHRQQGADWQKRLNAFREQEWAAAQKLSAAAQCFLDSYDEDDLRRMSLAQVSRALKISSGMARAALAGVELPESTSPELNPLQQQLLAGLNRIYNQPASETNPLPSNPSTLNS